MPAARLLFVCSGNLCRSPMASAIALQVALERCLDIEVRSAGTLAEAGMPADSRVIRVAREVGLDLSEHRSERLTAEHVAWASQVAVMEDHHALAVRTLHEGCEPVHLGPLVGQAYIEDPMGRFWLRPYRTMRDQLFVAIRRMLTARG